MEVEWDIETKESIVTRTASAVRIEQGGVLVGVMEWDSGVSCGEVLLWAYTPGQWRAVERVRKGDEES